MKTFKKLFTGSLAFFSITAHASFIETTQGTAVVNDATASYFNPAALVLLKNPQLIPQVTLARFHTHFNGSSTALATGVTITGTASSNTNYFSPTFFLGVPVTSKMFVGLAIVSNAANRNADEHSILRYVQANNNIQDVDVATAIAIKLNNIFAIGGGITFAYANFDLQPINGFPGSNIADSQSHNQSDGRGISANLGFLIRLNPLTVMGFNYRSRTTYNLSGQSIYEGSPRVVSNSYHYKLWTPARAVFSINHYFNKQLGVIATIQRIQWHTLTNVHVYGVASVSGTTPVILNGTVPYHLHDTWMLTLGNHYRILPHWILRIAGTYSESPGNPRYQIANGDSITLGVSMGYEINKWLSIDGSYAHTFIQDESIKMDGGRFAIRSTNQGSRDGVSLKLTFNV